ncbi:MAG: uracil-DNA glycosylase [bacterium]
MEKFKAELRAFVDGIYEGEKKVLVFGEGSKDARVALVGEAPGEQETLLGRPFVGKAGKNLDEFLALAGLDRSALYVTNTVKFRPTKISPAGRIVNRPPTQEEIRLFLPWLQRELDMIAPACVVTLGNVPLKALMGRKAVIGELHGQFVDVDGRKLYPMYHPASLIYNPSLRETYKADVVRFGAWLRGENPTNK